jgi:hypothetical protein
MRKKNEFYVSFPEVNDGCKVILKQIIDIIKNKFDIIKFDEREITVDGHPGVGVPGYIIKYNGELVHDKSRIYVGEVMDKIYTFSISMEPIPQVWGADVERKLVVRDIDGVFDKSRLANRNIENKDQLFRALDNIGVPRKGKKVSESREGFVTTTDSFKKYLK